MATIITHALTGAAFGQAAPAGVPKVRMTLCLACAAALPDADVLMFMLGFAYDHPLGHRGFTHSIAFAAMLALFLSLAVIPKQRFSMKRYMKTLAVCFCAILSHGILDAITDAGLGVGFFIPLNDERYFFPWRPVMTATLNPSAFFSQATLEVLKNEIRLIWLPLAVTSVIFNVFMLLYKKFRQGCK